MCNVNRFNRRRAVLVCGTCGYEWSSGLPDALTAADEAATSVLSVNGVEVAEIKPIVMPHLPLHATPPRPTHGFIGLGTLAERARKRFRKDP